MTVLDALRTACPSTREKEPMSRHSSFAIGGPADYYADVRKRDELVALRHVCREQQVPVFFIGAGSNLLIADAGIRALVIHLQEDFRKIDFNGKEVRVGAGTWMPSLAKQCAFAGLAGVESLIGVPGTIGGGLVMNAGTREGVLGDVVQSIELLDESGVFEECGADTAGFTYRHSNLEGSWITGAALKLKFEDPKSITVRMDEYLKYRSRTQPLATNNCGSVFKNPQGHAAAQLVQEAGLKGASVGSARVSELHANFILNEKNARAADVRALIEKIQSAVFQKSGVALETEVKFVGEWEPKS